MPKNDAAMLGRCAGGARACSVVFGDNRQKAEGFSTDKMLVTTLIWLQFDPSARLRSIDPCPCGAITTPRRSIVQILI
jgi:hypothetical protein